MCLDNVLASNQVLHLRLLRRYFYLCRPEFGKDQLHVIQWMKNGTCLLVMIRKPAQCMELEDELFRDCHKELFLENLSKYLKRSQHFLA